MRKLNLIVLVTMILSITLWSVGQTSSFAEQFGAKHGSKVSAHASGAVIGKSIRSESGVVLGTVENVILNDSGCAQYVILYGEFEGAHSRLYPIPFTVISRTSHDAFFVNLEPAVLVRAPSFERGSLPDFAQWDSKVHSFYRTQAETTVPGKHGRAGETPGTLRGEGGKPEKGVGAQREQWKQPASEGLEKAKGKHEGQMVPDREHKGKSSPGSQEMMEKGPSKMMEQGPSKMMEQGRPHTESGHSGAVEHETPAKKAPVPGEGTVGPGVRDKDVR
jgi:hypothetical protein